MRSTPPVLLCCDLDRTLLPNGVEPESALARPLFNALCARDDVCLAYVSGRDVRLVQAAIDEYKIPVPDFAICDVGSTIFHVKASQWQAVTAWQEMIATDWKMHTPATMIPVLADIAELELQAGANQSRFKLSYYAPVNVNRSALLATIKRRLETLAITFSLNWSIDVAADIALLDILPHCATKVGALRFLMQRYQFSPQRTVFAGDSGNDLSVLTSGLASILVANAQDDVRSEALAALAVEDQHCLYQARGNFLGMNGHYAAGILEGLVHFHPRYLECLEVMAEQIRT